MDKSKFNKGIKNFGLYKKIIYVLVILSGIIQLTVKSSNDNGYLLILVFCLVINMLVDILITRVKYFDSGAIFCGEKYLVGSAYAISMVLFVTNPFVLLSLSVMSALNFIEFILFDSECDNTNIGIRKITALIPVFISAAVGLEMLPDRTWICTVMAQVCTYVMVLLVSDWIITQEEEFSKINNKLTNEISSIESANEKLIEYQEKVKNINEQINYQKINLARTNKNLEQANIEVASQSEIMKYMASTFDVLKCINYITDAVMEVKKPKLCALYIDKDVYYNKFSSCIIKTNYTSMQRRLKKDIETIYSDMLSSGSDSVIYSGDDVKKFRFVGDANINNLAFMALRDKTATYGLMIVGSDRADFFSDGITYYETCIVEFTVAIKSTKMYLKMQDMARKDGLTGIYNRIYFNELFKSAATRARKYDKKLSVALFDIDKFKKINDTYGHLAGDEVIKMVAGVADRYAEKNKGFACRYGGEEFLIVVPDFDENDFIPVLEEMHNEIKSTIVKYKDDEIHVNVCIGFTSYPSLCDNTDHLVNRADMAMYYGKKHGRGRLVQDSPEIEEAE